MDSKPEKQIKNLNEAEDLLFKILEDTGNLIGLFQEAYEVKAQNHRKNSAQLNNIDNYNNGAMEMEEIKENGVEIIDTTAICKEGVHIYESLMNLKKNMKNIIEELEPSYPKQSKLNSLAVLEAEVSRDSMNSFLSGFALSLNDEKQVFDRGGGGGFDK